MAPGNQEVKVLTAASFQTAATAGTDISGHPHLHQQRPCKTPFGTHTDAPKPWPPGLWFATGLFIRITWRVFTTLEAEATCRGGWVSSKAPGALTMAPGQPVQTSNHWLHDQLVHSPSGQDGHGRSVPEKSVLTDADSASTSPGRAYHLGFFF